MAKLNDGVERELIAPLKHVKLPKGLARRKAQKVRGQLRKVARQASAALKDTLAGNRHLAKVMSAIAASANRP